MLVTPLSRPLKKLRRFVIVLMSVLIFTMLLFTFSTVRPPGQRTDHQNPPPLRMELAPGHGVENLPPIYVARHQQLQAACRGSNGIGNTENILVYRNMSYGVVPKAGCTFWIRIFRFLHNDTNGRVLESPFQMTRTEAHGGNRTIKMYRLQRREDRRVVMATTRFMVARNPFTRLFSAYMDKLFLPDMWSSAGRRITSRRNNVSHVSQECGHDVTFTEFLTYVADVGEVDPLSLNGHWRPIEYACNPCTFRPHIVATQETFTQDSRFIMDTFGLGYLLQNHSHTRHVLDEIEILTDWNFRVHACVSRKLLALKIWQTFQVNGYLTRESERVVDEESEESLTKDRLKYLVTESYKSSTLSKEDSRKQRQYYLQEAYQKVPGSVLDRIVRIYKNDFLYFGYSSSLNDLFL